MSRPAEGAAPSSDARAPDAWAKRFDRQARFAPLGAAGQARLQRASVLVVGCGALGGAAAHALARCGIGRLVIADRDVVEESNLPRQVLFTNAQLGLPKVEAAAATLAAIGGPTRVEPNALHVDARALESLGAGVDLVVDGTDNLATRYLLNDWAVARRIPWIYAGVVGASGLVLGVRPGRGPCLRCLFPTPAPAGSLETCESAGVILPAVELVSALQIALALRWLAAEQLPAETSEALQRVDVWRGECASLALERDPQCPCCGAGRYEFLDAAPERAPVALCGRNTVQIQARAASGAQRLDTAALAARLGAAGVRVERAGSLLRFEAEAVRFTLFPDGRALLEGIADLDRARALYDRWIGR
ncbi:MAG: thiazole biosynthesis adenylyltransferase ThiF [Planctomycetota bacterium]|nr:MAG: thiazole biosynthesis adenylyltransferase ThiF [Planctomycetota bacterium]